MFQIEAAIIENRKLAPDCFKMALLAPEIAKTTRPGQFVHIRCHKGYSPLLRRPFSVLRADKRKGQIEILYQVVGEGTRLLSNLQPGNLLDLLGPLGNGFQADKNKETFLIIAGGIGVAGIFALAEELSLLKSKVIVLMGAKRKELVLSEEEFRKTGAEVFICTDDGSCGFKGMVTDLLKAQVSALRPQASQMFACGPKEMLKEVAQIAQEYNFPCQISLEEQMGCGVGVCRGCAVKIKKGSYEWEYRRVCADGPIFEATQVLWEKEI